MLENADCTNSWGYEQQAGDTPPSWAASPCEHMDLPARLTLDWGYTHAQEVALGPLQGL